MLRSKQRSQAMRILISIVLIVALCVLVLAGLMGVLRELLIRITVHSPSQHDGRVGSERAAVGAMVSEDIQ
jgi:hypothetical protein